MMNKVTCPYCGIDVMPSPEGRCPACEGRWLVDSELQASDLANEHLTAFQPTRCQTTGSVSSEHGAAKLSADTAESAVGAGAEVPSASAPSSPRPHPAALVSVALLAVVGLAATWIVSSALTDPTEAFEQFASKVETRLQQTRVGFAFENLTPSTVQINTWRMGVIHVEATRQSDHSHVDFTLRYSCEPEGWILEDAELSGDMSAQDAAETDLARGAKSELLAAFSPDRAPGASYYHNRARSLNDAGQHDKAMAHCNEALEIDPRDAEAMLLRACAWHGKEEYDKARQDCSESLRLAPTGDDAWAAFFVRGMAFADEKQYDKAIGDLSESLRLEPENTKTLCYRSVIWTLMREYDKALADLDAALQLDPQDASAWVMRSSVWTRKEDYERAIEDANKAVEFSPDSAFAYCVRGRARFLVHRDYEEAIEDCRKALQLDSDEETAYRVLAWIQATCPEEKFRDGADAILNAEQANRLTVNSYGVVNTLAAAYAEDGQFDKAAEWQQRAIELLAEDEYASDEEKEELRSRRMLYTQGKPYREQRGIP